MKKNLLKIFVIISIIAILGTVIGLHTTNSVVYATDGYDENCETIAYEYYEEKNLFRRISKRYVRIQQGLYIFDKAFFVSHIFPFL